MTTQTMEDNPIIFEEQGHPSIKLFEDKISIKAIDYSGFRDFKFDKIKSIELYRPYENSIIGFLFSLQPGMRNFREKDDYVLRVKLKDGEHWDYNTTYRYSNAFKKLIEDIQERLKTKDNNV